MAKTKWSLIMSVHSIIYLTCLIIVYLRCTNRYERSQIKPASKITLLRLVLILECSQITLYIVPLTESTWIHYVFLFLFSNSMLHLYLHTNHSRIQFLLYHTTKLGSSIVCRIKMFHFVNNFILFCISLS